MTTMMKVQAERAGRSLVRKAALPGPTHPTQELASDDDDPTAADDDDREDYDDGCESKYPLHLEMMTIMVRMLRMVVQPPYFESPDYDYTGEDANAADYGKVMIVMMISQSTLVWLRDKKQWKRSGHNSSCLFALNRPT